MCSTPLQLSATLAALCFIEDTDALSPLLLAFREEAFL